MVLCWIALPIFAILGIFSAKYRKLTWEALDCLFHTVTLRKCKSGLDDRMRSSAAGKALKVSPRLGKFVYKHFTILSLLLMVFFAWSAYATAVGGYNYYLYGNCNGPESTGFCVFDPTGANTGTSEIDYMVPENTVWPVLEDDDPIIGPENAELTIIEFGCYLCKYTKKAESITKEVLDYYDGRVNIQFKTFYIPSHKNSFEASLAAECAKEQGKYLAYHNALFEKQEMVTIPYLYTIAEDIGLDSEQFRECLNSQKYHDAVDEDSKMGINAGVLGTPTFFIGDQKIVGPKPLRTFQTVIDEELE